MSSWLINESKSLNSSENRILLPFLPKKDGKRSTSMKAVPNSARVMFHN